MSVIETLLAETFGVPVDDAKVRAVIKAMHQAGVLDRWAIIRHQVQSDSCRDYKVVMRRYHVSRGFVFASWNALAEPRGLSAASPWASGKSGPRA